CQQSCSHGQYDTARRMASSTQVAFLGYGVTCAYMLSAFFLVGCFKDADSHVAPPPYPGTAVSASDETLICRMVWDDESIAATLTALEGGGIRVRLGRLWHGTASIPVTLHKTTSTRWLTGLFLGLGLPQGVLHLWWGTALRRGGPVSRTTAREDCAGRAERKKSILKTAFVKA